MDCDLCHSFVAFVEPLSVRSPIISFKRPHATQCNINRTSDPSREDEIAAKIANLRKRRRLRAQSPQSNNSDINKSEVRSPTHSHDASTGLSFEDLPDWKKEQVLESQIADAEEFFYRKSNNFQHSPQLDSKSLEKPGDYRPKVSTWGIFPRPDNISKTYGGGRRIQMGGVELNNLESRMSDGNVKERLAAYRASHGIDMEKEEAHRGQVEAALCDAERLMKQTRPYDAMEKLETVTDFTSDLSRLGGTVLLSLALAYEAVGRRDDAREIYVRLRKNPFSEISGKAKQLMQGFTAMEQLGVDDESRLQGSRVSRFVLPDITYASDKRYETVVFGNNGKQSRREESSVSIILGLFAVMFGPAFLILLLILWRR